MPEYNDMMTLLKFTWLNHIAAETDIPPQLLILLSSLFGFQFVCKQSFVIAECFFGRMKDHMVLYKPWCNLSWFLRFIFLVVNLALVASSLSSGVNSFMATYRTSIFLHSGFKKLFNFHCVHFAVHFGLLINCFAESS